MDRPNLAPTPPAAPSPLRRLAPVLLVATLGLALGIALGKPSGVRGQLAAPGPVLSDAALQAAAHGELTAGESKALVRDALQSGEMCSTDLIVYVADNAASTVRVASVDYFLTPRERCRVTCGGRDCDEYVERTFLMGPYASRDDAWQALCGAVEDSWRDAFDSPCPIWIRVNGNEYRLTSAAAGQCDFDAPPPPPVPTASHGEGRCIEIPPSPTAYATPTPETVTIRGQIYTITAEGRIPLVDVPVILLHNGVEVRRSVAERPLGRYELRDIERDDGFALQVNLEHARVPDGDPSWFEVRYGRQDGPLAQIRTVPFDTHDIPGTEVLDLPFAGGAVYEYRAIPPARLRDLAVIYYHTHQAWQLADQLEVPLDLDLPLEVVGYVSGDDRGAWWGPHSTGTRSGFDPYIALGADRGYSDLTSGSRPHNREWHEFGHHVMAEAYGNLLPQDPDPANRVHAGYRNPSTTDSWREGFAEFYSLLVARDIEGAPQPWLYPQGGVALSLEVNRRAWSPVVSNPRWRNSGLQPGDWEEFAVAGLLWDLADPVDERDARRLSDGTWYRDAVEVDRRTLWWLLTRDWAAAGVPAPDAPDGYGYLFDVKHLYDALRTQGVGSGNRWLPELSDLDELFVMHGFFADLNDNRAWDEGEAIGRAAYGSRPDRRSAPTIPGSYVAVGAVDESGTPLQADALEYRVEVRFQPPLDYFDYSYRSRLDASVGKLYFVGQAPDDGATTYISASGNGYASTEPLVIPDELYWERMADGPTDHFLEHTFVMRAVPAYLPLLKRQGAGSRPPVGTDIPVPSPTPQPPDRPTATAVPTARATEEPGEPDVIAVEPDRVAAGTTVRVTVLGYDFASGAIALIGDRLLDDLVYPGPEPEPPYRDRIEGTLPSGLEPGTYDVRVVNPGGRSDVLPDAFRVEPGAATATPRPSATPAGTVRLERAFVTSNQNDPQGVFEPFESIHLWLEVGNTGPAPASVRAEWTVEDPGGETVAFLSHDETVTIPPGGDRIRLERTLPSDNRVGEYTLTGRVVHGADASVQRARFYVAHERLVEQDFEVPVENWAQGARETGFYRFVDGAYSIRVDLPNRILWSAPLNTRADDFALEVTGWRVRGDDGRYGLLFGLDDDATRYNLFRVDDRGRYAVHRVDRGPDGSSWTTIVPWTADPAIRTGIQSDNHLMLVRRGDRITLYANGDRLTTATAPQLPAVGRQGVVAAAGEDAPAEHRFDNFRLYRIAPGAP